MRKDKKDALLFKHDYARNLRLKSHWDILPHWFRITKNKRRVKRTPKGIKGVLQR